MKNVKLNLKKSAKSGFNLIEMLVVIAVIGVIAAIAIPNIGGINKEAAAAEQVKSDQQQTTTLVRPTDIGTEASHILMEAWNHAVGSVVKYEAGRDVTQIVMLVTMSPSKYGLDDKQSGLLKSAHSEQFKDLQVDDSNGQLVLAKSVNPTASSLKPGPSNS